MVKEKDVLVHIMILGTPLMCYGIEISKSVDHGFGIDYIGKDGSQSYARIDPTYVVSLLVEEILLIITNVLGP